MANPYSVEQYKKAILANDRAMLSRAITMIESTRTDDKKQASDLIDSILPYAGKSIRIGITGVPGVGKSTFIEAFGMALIAMGKKVAVLAIDPSSSISHGSILGDKTRMEQLSVHPHAFIRPTASSGSLGGITYKTHETILLCEAAGFDVIIVETVGVGQSETEVSQICDFFLLLMLAGAGDELQGIKRGIMELADGVVITKADSGNAEKAKAARSEYARALHFMPPTASGWIPQVKVCSAYQNEGIKEVWEMISQFVQQQSTNGYFYENRKQQNIFAFHRLLQEQLRDMLLRKPGLKDQIQDLEQQIIAGNMSPYTAVGLILN